MIYGSYAVMFEVMLARITLCKGPAHIKGKFKQGFYAFILKSHLGVLWKVFIVKSARLSKNHHWRAVHTTTMAVDMVVANHHNHPQLRSFFIYTCLVRMFVVVFDVGAIF
jgi:hypothetical protein